MRPDLLVPGCVLGVLRATRSCHIEMLTGTSCAFMVCVATQHCRHDEAVCDITAACNWLHAMLRSWLARHAECVACALRQRCARSGIRRRGVTVCSSCFVLCSLALCVKATGLSGSLARSGVRSSGRFSSWAGLPALVRSRGRLPPPGGHIHSASPCPHCLAVLASLLVGTTRWCRWGGIYTHGDSSLRISSARLVSSRSSMLGLQKKISLRLVMPSWLCRQAPVAVGTFALPFLAEKGGASHSCSMARRDARGRDRSACTQLALRAPP